MSSQVGPRAAARLIASREFGPYFFGNALSASGGWFQNLAAAILVYRLTGSELLLGVLAFSQFIPVLLLAPWAGSAADRFDRRRLIVLVQSVAAALAALVAVLAWAGLATAPVVIAISAGLGITAAFTVPAASALLASLVDRRDLPSAVGLNSMTYNIARAVGPALAGVTVATLGIPAAFALNAVSYLALVVGVAVSRPRRLEPSAAVRFRDSLRLLRREPRLAALLGIVMLVGFASDPINTLAPAFAHAFGRPDTEAGFVIGVFGAGAVTAAFLLAGRVAGSRRRLTTTLTLLGAGVAAFALTPWLPLALALLFVGGFGYLASNTAATARLQLEVEEAQRGRIMALWGVAFLGLRPIASLVDGAIASAFGVRVAGVALAAPALLAALAIVLVGRRRRAASVEIRELEPGDLEALERDLPSPHHRRRAALHEAGTATFLVAWRDARPVGYLLVRWDGADEEIVHRLLGTFPELNAVTVRPQLQSRGIGSALIEDAERRVAERGCSRVGLAVGIDNPRARALYERLGYECWEHGTLDVSWPVPGEARRESETCVYLTKEL